MEDSQEISKDSRVTISAIGLLAYASADIAHHVLGHGAACLMLGGSINSLSSVYVDCTLRGSVIDLAGPFANLFIGLSAFFLARFALKASSAMRLFIILVAAFNLLWFCLHLVYSAATRRDDWAWAMQEFHVSEPIRYGLILIGIVGYLMSRRAIAFQLLAFANPLSRVNTIVWIAWLSAGVLACATAAFDQHPVAVLLHQAIPQSLVFSIALLFVPSRVAKASASHRKETIIAFSLAWVTSAAVVGMLSMTLLEPGISIAL